MSGGLEVYACPDGIPEDVLQNVRNQGVFPDQDNCGRFLVAESQADLFTGILEENRIPFAWLC